MNSALLSLAPNSSLFSFQQKTLHRQWYACLITWLFVLGLAGLAGAQERTFTVLHKFNGADGIGPYLEGLIKDAEGNLYGTASGGDSTCRIGGCGVVYKVDTNGNETVLYTFKGGADGIGPIGALVRDAAGNLYGITQSGGTKNAGTVYRLDRAGIETVLYSFTGGTDGWFPAGALLRDAAGNFYGSTTNGGIDPVGTCHGSGCGVVFKLDAAGHETVLYSFKGEADGNGTGVGLVRDAAGNFYGVTGVVCNGGFCSAVFKVDKDGNESILYTLTNGGYTLGPMIVDAAGNLYGTTFNGGNLSCSFGGGTGCGTVFKIDSAGNETTLHTFAGGSDGAGPSGALIRDAAGYLWGTTTSCGTFPCSFYSAGTVYRLAPNGKKMVLHRFGTDADGRGPSSGVIRDAAGNFYGTTTFGGNATCNDGSECGTVFKIGAFAP